MGKVLLEDAVHLGEVRHVVQEHVHLDDLVDGRAGFLQDGQDVLAALRGLVRDAAGDQGAGFVGGDLARDVDVGAGDYGLRLGWGVLVRAGLWGKLGWGGRAWVRGGDGEVVLEVVQRGPRGCSRCSPRLGWL